MKKIMMFLVALLLIGCSDPGAEQSEGLEVVIESTPKKVLLNETVTFTAIVRYGNAVIKDDAEVKFEIIENGVSIGMVSPTSLGEGKYVLDTKFFEPGEKQVIAHVDYKALHEMPVLTFHVVNGGEES